MSKALFIGGPWDGRLIEHSLESPTVRVRVRERFSSFIDYNRPVDEAPMPVTVREVTYVRFPLFGYDLMIEESVYKRGVDYHRKHPAEVAMDLLAQGYRRPSNIFGDV
jgi:hypothetical protein